MSTVAAATLHAFAYGEHLEDLTQRSLGYRLLAPVEPAVWSAEVETLARRLQAAPYPDHWPPCDLFCSVLLADGHRLVALARYGLADHTSSQRRGGLEMVGVIAPTTLEVPAARRIYEWLKKRRGDNEDPRRLGGVFSLDDILAAAPALPAAAPADPTPVLPVRLWQEGALLFAATTPSDPDHRLNLLEQEASSHWQWLPLVGDDLLLQTYAQRGPLVAWTPHLSGVAVKLDRKHPEAPPRLTAGRRLLSGVALLLVIVAGLGIANLSVTLALSRQVAAGQGAAGAEPRAEPQPPAPSRPAADETRERFAEALYEVLADNGVVPQKQDEAFLAEYDRLARDHAALAVTNRKGRIAVGAVGALSQRSIPRIEDLIRKALQNKGFDKDLIEAAVKKVREELTAEPKKTP
jgi:hypothetical protein